MISKDRIVFNVDVISEADNVGAYIRSGDSGALITNRTLADTNPGISFVFVDADINAGADTITEAAHGLSTGDKVQFTTSGTLPSALALLTNYWIIRSSASTFKVASSAANAEQGIAIDLAADGSGNHTLTSQAVARRALDVYVANEINVDLDASTDSIASWTNDGSGNPIASTGTSLNVHVTGSGPLTVSATNLDIRDLVFATDKVDVTGSAVSITGTVAVTQSTSPWVVSATDLDIRNLVFATDKVDVSGSSVTTNDAALANTALLNTQKDVSTTGTILASQLANRKYFWFQNLGNKSVFFGAAGVTKNTGLRISSGSYGEFRLGAAIIPHAVSSDGSAQDTRVMEAS